MKLEDLTIRQIRNFCDLNPSCDNCELSFFCFGHFKDSDYGPYDWQDDDLEREIDI